MKKEKMKVTTFVRNKDYYYVIRTIQIIPHYPLRLRIIYSLFVTPIWFRYNLGIKWSKIFVGHNWYKKNITTISFVATYKICHVWNISKNVKLFCCWYFAFTFNRYLSCTPRELCLFRSEIVNIFEYHMTESRIKRRNLLPWYQNLHVFFLRMAVHHANKCTYTSRR